MITGPSIGPAMVLLVLMRWPSLIVVCALSGAGALVYNNMDSQQIRHMKNNFASIAEKFDMPLPKAVASSDDAVNTQEAEVVKTSAN